MVVLLKPHFGGLPVPWHLLTMFVVAMDKRTEAAQREFMALGGGMMLIAQGQMGVWVEEIRGIERVGIRAGKLVEVMIIVLRCWIKTGGRLVEPHVGREAMVEM